MDEWRRRLRPLVRNRVTLLGLSLVALFVLAGLLGPWIAPHPEDAAGLPEARDRSLPPARPFPFGTDSLGRDILSRVIMGARISLLIIGLTVTLAGALGVGLGLTAGYFGGWFGEISMRITDIFLALPPLILAMLIATTLGRGIYGTVLAVGLTWWPRYARLARSETLRLREALFVEAAVALGAPHARILRRHILANLLSPAIVQASLDSGRVLLTAAALGFLGLGARPPEPEWGLMIAIGRDYWPMFWWESVFPGLAIFVVVMGLNLFGDGLRTVLDPRQQARGLP